MLFIAGRILGRMVEFYCMSVAACVSSMLLWWRESPFKKSFFYPILMVSELFLRVAICLRLLVF